MVVREVGTPPYRHFGVAVATWDSYIQGTYHAEEIFMEQWQQFQVMVPQLVPSREAPFS